MRLGIRGKLLLAIGVPTLVVYVGVLGAMMLNLRHVNRAEVEAEMTRRAQGFAGRFDGAFREAAAIAQATARFMETAPALSESQLFQQLRANVRQDPLVYGAALAFEPAVRGGEELFSPYVHRTANGLAEMNISRQQYDWHGDEQWQWWHAPTRLGRPVWTDPYFDDGAGDTLMVTHSAPFYVGDALHGVATVDVEIAQIREKAGRAILEDLDFVIFNERGQFVFSQQESEVMGATIFEIAERVNRPDIAEASRDIVSGAAGVTALAGWSGTPPPDWDGWTETQWVFYAPIESTGWSLAVLLPERVAMADVRDRMTQASIALAATLGLILICIWFVAWRLTRPILTLRAAAAQVAGGDLDARVEGVAHGDEIGDLAIAFNRMTGQLRGHVDRLATEQAAREKIERDLNLARDIQRSLLPQHEPVTPGFDVGGWNEPADQTGGDYFDWLTLPDGRTILTLADVTGHGVGPALIVSVCRAYMRASTSSDDTDLSEAVERVNALLHEDIPSGRFVTAAIGVLDPESSVLNLISAGQAPLLYYEAASDHVHVWNSDAVPLGILPELGLGSPRVIEFQSGDVLLLTTDGFMEWPDPSGEQFGIERLGAFLHAHHQLTSQEMIARLHAAVLAHADGVPQGDDLTALVIRKH